MKSPREAEIIELDSDSDDDPTLKLSPQDATIPRRREFLRSPSIETQQREEREAPRQHATDPPNHRHTPFIALDAANDNLGEEYPMAHDLGVIRRRRNQFYGPRQLGFNAPFAPFDRTHLPLRMPMRDGFPTPPATRPHPTPQAPMLQAPFAPRSTPPAEPGYFDFGDDEDFHDAYEFPNNIDPVTPPAQLKEDSSPAVEFDIVLQQVAELFPGICPRYVKEIYDDRVALAPTAEDLGERVILQIIEKGDKYPKKKVKRKRRSYEGSGDDEDEEEIAKYTNKHREPASAIDIDNARSFLKRDFPSIPVSFLNQQLQEHRHLYPAYCETARAEMAREDLSWNKSSYDPLKKRRVTKGSPPCNVSEHLDREYEFAKKQIAKDRNVRAKKKQDAEEDAALDRQAFDDGDIKECECCFTDCAIRKMVQCNGPDPHFFCIDCMAGHIKAQLDYQKYKISCMDSGGCKAEFSRASKMNCLDKNTFTRLERVQQQAELREANVPGLETCPFCDFAAICPPIEEDKEFRCEHPDCNLVSCRLCRNKSHVPKSCAESKKEHGIEERHIVEEEMTKALVRICSKCRVSILKTEGCNKIVCSRCGQYICDVCGKDITKDGYNHFGPGKCAQYDYGSQGAATRENKRVQEAEKAAKAKVRAENPDITEEDLEIKFSDVVQKREERLGQRAGPNDVFLNNLNHGNIEERGPPDWGEEYRRDLDRHERALGLHPGELYAQLPGQRRGIWGENGDVHHRDLGRHERALGFRVDENPANVNQNQNQTQRRGGHGIRDDGFRLGLQLATQNGHDRFDQDNHMADQDLNVPQRRERDHNARAHGQALIHHLRNMERPPQRDDFNHNFERNNRRMNSHNFNRNYRAREVMEYPDEQDRYRGDIFGGRGMEPGWLQRTRGFGLNDPPWMGAQWGYGAPDVGAQQQPTQIFFPMNNVRQFHAPGLPERGRRRSPGVWN